MTRSIVIKEISVPARRINEIVHGKRAINADTALRLARFFGPRKDLERLKPWLRVPHAARWWGEPEFLGRGIGPRALASLLEKLRDEGAPFAGMATSIRKKTWREKLADREAWPKFVKLEKSFPCYNAVHKMGAESHRNTFIYAKIQTGIPSKGIPRGLIFALALWLMISLWAISHPLVYEGAATVTARDQVFWHIYTLGGFLGYGLALGLLSRKRNRLKNAAPEQG